MPRLEPGSFRASPAILALLEARPDPAAVLDPATGRSGVDPTRAVPSMLPGQRRRMQAVAMQVSDRHSFASQASSLLSRPGDIVGWAPVLGPRLGPAEVGPPLVRSVVVSYEVTFDAR